MNVLDLKKVEKTVKDALNKLGDEYPGIFCNKKSIFIILNSNQLRYLIGLYYSMQTTPLPPEIEISLSSDHVFFSRKGRETSSETK